MGKFIHHSLIFVFLLAVLPQISAQDPGQNNKTKTTVDGKDYFLHVVKKGETLYSIGKTYNISEKDIAIENPEVFDGLKTGQTLKIPIPEEDKNVVDAKPDTSQYIQHTVKKGETLYSLSKKYNVKILDITQLNPGVEKSFKTGDIIKIPKERSEYNISLESLKDQLYIYHKVKKKDTFFSLSKKYDTEIAKIYKVNPGLEEKGLKAGDTIRIPKKKKKEKYLYAKIDSLLDINDTLFITDTVTVPCDSFDYKLYDKPFNIALLLPFYTKENQYLDVEKVIDEEERIFPNTRFLEFYEGALLAVDSLRKTGIDINLYVFDTSRDTNKVKKIISLPAFKTMDLIIGPVYINTLKFVSDFAYKNNIFVISPLSSNGSLTQQNPGIIQINPTFSSQVETALRSLNKYYDKNFIIISNDLEEESKLPKICREKLLTVLAEVTDTGSVKIHEVLFKAKGIKGIKEVMSESDTNIAIIPSFYQPFVSDVISRLNIMLRNKKIILFGLPRWNTFENVELIHLFNLQMITFSSYYIDYNDSGTKNFIRKYRDMYIMEPSEFSFKGYDVMLFFLTALKEYGKEFGQCLPSVEATLLHSDFNFRKVNETGGYENTTIYNFRYDKEEFDIIRIDN